MLSLDQIMSKDMFKTPKMNRPQMKSYSEGWNAAKKRKVKNRFLSFCDIVLEYTQYEHMKREDLRTHSTSPLDSGGSTAESFDSLSNYTMEDDNSRMSLGTPLSSPEHTTELVSRNDGDSFESVTCYCRKPFAGRPMIECNKCLTWIHLSCAKIRRNNIPDEFTCQRCREARSNKRKSNRMKLEKLGSPSATSTVVAAMS